MNSKNPLFSPSPEHILLRSNIRQFTTKMIEPGALDRDKHEYFDRALFKRLGDIGLLGITVPLEYGGAGMDAVAAVIAHEELSYSDPGLCLAYLAHSMLCVNNIAINANHEQKLQFLPKLCSGEWIGAMAMSEPEVGTDVLAMQSLAVESDTAFQLNGRKMWITNGAVDNDKNKADCVFVYAKTPVEEGKHKISSFIVTKNLAGFHIGQIIKGKLGMRASITAELVFDNCLVPKSNLIGQKGDSLVHMMRNLEIERLALAAIGLGLARRCLEIMISYANQRKAYGKTLMHFGQIQRYVAESYAEYQACRAYVYNVATLMHDAFANHRVDSDGAKLISAAMSKRVADNAIQVLGGNGYIDEYVVERLWRDAKLLEIGGGTLEAHQKNMAKDLSTHHLG